MCDWSGSPREQSSGRALVSDAGRGGAAVARQHGLWLSFEAFKRDIEEEFVEEAARAHHVRPRREEGAHFRVQASATKHIRMPLFQR
ncbi:hypothetical protein EVAR_11470_1 [Eumeta japonica]|uniref:Uncharacterized protein n=1 Tax=Eumeta variegata TaxID=151549 RepID=A0A4C1TLT1_EUMVA|nr:hypothetical protein EVAR_11470_1 [Eumeta japonica]